MSEAVKTFGLVRCIRLLTHRAPGELRVRMLTGSGASFLIDLRARHAARLRVVIAKGLPKRRTEYVPHAWPITHGPQRTFGSKDPFLMATKWAYKAMFPPRDDGDSSDPDAPATMRAVYAALAGLEREAAALCDPGARNVVMRFQPHLRFWLYGRLVGDPSGRLEQLAAVCPGALFFAFALEHSGHSAEKDASARLLADVIAGRRLDRALGDAIEVWAAEAADRAIGAPEHIDPVWDRVYRASGAERQRLLARQQLLIRRAGPMVATTNLFLPPPISFVAEDIPLKVRDNARWFSMVKCSRLLLAEPVEGERQRCECLAAFVSKNAVALRRGGGMTRPGTLVGALRDYAVATNRWPVRATGGWYLDDAARWHEQIAVIRGVAELQELVAGPPIDPQSPLPGPPIGEWRDDAGSLIAPVTSVGGLIEEGNLMHHCVASKYPEVARGSSAIYHASIEGKPLTVEIKPLPAYGGWGIEEAKGIANREPSAAQWTVLRRWEAGLR
jgi:hypothetical protein